jgi:membrane-associated protease RseP (regulator of RpoE activity)
MNITVPTFVPSLITGITSAVTTFKSPPKNREAMFDFAIAGPFAGIIASVVALYFGLQFTLYSTAEAAAQFPALPLEILRQSTLGGGIIEYMLGAGALAVPGGSEGTSAISSITIPLHPVAIAGYISLIVNALALLPIGSKFVMCFTPLACSFDLSLYLLLFFTLVQLRTVVVLP